MNELHIDIVFPFCPRHCDYCDALTHTGRVSDFERYANALERSCAPSPQTRKAER